MTEPFAFEPGATAQSGRVALVTGGEAGLGAVVVRALAARGHAVAIHAHAALGQARALADRLVAAGVPSLAVTADLRDDGATRTLVHRVADHFGRIDALVACAAVAHACRLEDLTADDLRLHFDVNCVGAFVAAQEVGAVMVAQETGGGIVLVGDASTARPLPGQLAAGVSLGAIPVLTRCLAGEFAARNPRVRVNCVLPGGPPSGAAEHSRVAHAVTFLLENDLVTAACLPVDGGRTSLA